MQKTPLLRRPNHDISPIDEEDAIPFPAARPRPDQRKMSAHYILPSQQRAASRQGSNNTNNNNNGGPPGRSNLPMMRRERRQQQRDAEAVANRGIRSSSGHDGSRDGPESEGQEYTSPPPRGRIPRAMPSRERLKTPVRQQPEQYSRGLGISTMSSKSPPSQHANNSTVPPKSSDTDPAATAFLANRPGWRGPSGRTAIVDPVQDNTAVEPLKIPTKSARRAVSPVVNNNKVGAGGHAGDIAMASPPISPETQAPAGIGGRPGYHGGSAWQGPQTVISSVSGPAKSTPPSKMSALSALKKTFIPSSMTSSGSQRPQQLPAPPLAPAQGNPSPPLDPSNRSIRRKEVASSHLSTPNTNNHPPPRHQPHDSFSSSVYSRPSQDQNQTVGDPYPQPPPNTIRLNAKELPTLPPADYVQPPSCFSVTTYATSAASPRHSLDADAPPLPTPPKDIVMGLPQQQLSPLFPPDNNGEESVLSRARPKLRGGNNSWEDAGPDEAPIKISLTKAWMSTAGANSAGIDAQNSPERTRKPKGKDDETNRSAGGFLGFFTSALSPTSTTTTPTPPKPMTPASSDSTPTSRPASILSVDKALPLAPAQEITSTMGTTTGTGVGSRIDQLNALLSGLGNRRININRAIEQMTKLMPQDNLMATEAVARKREAEKRKIEELESELADIQREEHELGMKLHRAYKKLDRQTEYEPTTLWVRRAAR